MFRILALDGGGIKGTFTAAVLAELEGTLGKPLMDYFDLVVGTSTGGIIALGMGCGYTPDRILELYKEKGHQIFPPAARGWTGLLEWIFGPRYNNDGLKQALVSILGERRFKDIEFGIAITSFDAASGKPVVFKTGYHPSLVAYEDLSVLDVALATSAAPTYFPAAKTGAGVMIDGGVWANCPAMVGITEALSLLKHRVTNIRVLSVGTTSSPTFVDRTEREGGLLHWAKPIPSLLMHASRLGTLAQAGKLCGVLRRVDEDVEPTRFKLDDASDVDDLEQLGRSAARRMFDDIKKNFLLHRVRRRAAGKAQPAGVRA